MRLLLDTHAFLWYVLDDPRLSVKADAVVSDPSNDVLVSPASYWEIAIKISLGKYSLPEPYHVFMEREIAANSFVVLPIEPRRAAVVSNLPFHHRDPFDRLLVAQCLVEQIPLVSSDSLLDGYGISRLW